MILEFSDGCCRPIRMHKVWRAIGISYKIVEQLPSLFKDMDMIWARVVPVKNSILAIMLALKDAEVNS